MDGFDSSKFGDVAIGVATGGISSIFNGDMAGTWTGAVDSGTEFWSNVGSISAVPAG